MFSELRDTDPGARNDDHGRGNDVVLVQIAGDVEIGVVRETGDSGRFEAVGEREMVVPFPVSEAGNVVSSVVVIL